ncbi:L-2-hydroxyglutarate dehydrogenase, mitochondrial-like isoform X1 [Tigriopus californicus]|uniref:L-2-hydroxyglutarate dehydrogenase, mitochondrial-like isoform X1 n=1 Tax=Tigriopus californicus TaxID=6832 RepID=UPI0027DA1106|nr:L-2-hydroxyglutarate dehydrogenase, mitochondrial-like isoform X1 [Tigriopus californicus]
MFCSKLSKLISRNILPPIQSVSWITQAANQGTSSNEFDLVIVGGGIVGLATAQELIFRYPELKMALLEKEPELSTHQTGHNSGVIHAGLYYKPGSLMAQLCVEGLHSTYKYCDKHDIPYKKCGKLVVAKDTSEISRLEDLFERGNANQVPELQMLYGLDGIQQVEPHCRGVQAIWSPHTGIVNWEQVARQYGKVFEERGGHIKLNYEVCNFEPGSDPIRPIEIVDKAGGQSIKASYVLTCAGLQSDRVATMSGCASDPKIVPFRGEYLLLSPEKAKLIKGNIYPVPDPRFPFLGVHFTPRMNGEMWLGPNAVPAFKREGYKWTDVSLRDMTEILAYPGFLLLAKKYVSFGAGEMIRSLFPALTVKHFQEYIPSIVADDISHGPAGVRAQAMNTRGDLIGDFIFDSPPKESPLSSRILHCRNAPSPGATSSLAIARMMAQKIQGQFGLPARDMAKLY